MKTMLKLSNGNNTASKMMFSFLVSFFLLTGVFAGVIITPASCITGISADKASNAFSPAFTAMDDIIIKENKATDFAATRGMSKTLVLTAPAGWTFKPASGNIAFENGKDLGAVSMKVSRTTITIQFTVAATRMVDAIRISGVEIQATDGARINYLSNIYRSAANPGTAFINGIVSTVVTDGSDGTGFGVLSQNSGVATKLVFVTRPSQVIAGTILEQQPVIMTQDQFGNPTSNGLAATQNVKVKLSSGSGILNGTVVLNIGTSGGNGMVVCRDLRVNTPGAKKLIATSGDMTFAVTNEFSVSDEETSTQVSDENPDWICRL